MITDMENKKRTIKEKILNLSFRVLVATNTLHIGRALYYNKKINKNNN